ncbi:hypothetical protein [Rubinisphaera margarita]|uniref:hypothetical protein n=1 Tax=Rubinisphaera margarita TaxID=2909586 RepID=UPI001EE8F28A|nr:hypothetical protein [Rubinisphaera margarita]MCG6155686.1 hypothetical protein [Rubinisphaera margarita]
MTDNTNAPRLGLLSCSDFLFTTRILDTARALQREVRILKDAAALASDSGTEPPGLWIIDLDSAGEAVSHVAAVREQYPDLMVIGFGSHVEVDRLKQARAAGCQLVVPRSKMTTDLVNYLNEYLDPQS